MTEKKVMGFTIRSRNFSVLFFFIFNSLIWFFTTLTVVQKAPFFWLIFAATVISLLIGPLIAEKTPRMRFLFIWVLMGVISSLFSLFLPKLGDYGIAILLVLLGFSFGIGFPSCLALVPSLTRIEERGRIGGVVFLITYILLPLFIFTIGRLDVLSSSLPLAIWRALSLSLFLLKIDLGVSLKPISYPSILSNKQFLFYFLPWLSFSLINHLEQPILKQSLGISLWEILATTQFFLGSLLCLIGGWLMDFKGRRWTILIGFVALGLGYAALGFFPFILPVQAFFIAVDSIAWGIFTIAFGLVVWGDLASHYRAEKFYGLGSAPFLFAMLVATLSSPWLETLDPSKAFSLASFFLFLAVIPIFLAHELLPEKVLKERELRKYVEEVKKITEGERS